MQPSYPARRVWNLTSAYDIQIELQRRIECLRDRLSELGPASLRITGDLDLDAVPHEAVDGARSLTRACYGVMTVLDDSGQLERGASANRREHAVPGQLPLAARVTVGLLRG